MQTDIWSTLFLTVVVTEFHFSQILMKMMSEATLVTDQPLLDKFPEWYCKGNAIAVPGLAMYPVQVDALFALVILGIQPAQ